MIQPYQATPSFSQGFARFPDEAAAPRWAFDRLAWLVAPCLGVQGSTLFDLGPRKQHATTTGAAWKPSSHGWALDFSGGNYYAEADWIGQGGLPITLMCLFRAPDVTSAHPVIAIADSSSTTAFLQLNAKGDSGGDPIRAFSHSYGGSTGTADSSTGFVANQWHVATGVFAGVSERHAYLDGGGKSSNTNTTGVPTGHDVVSIGAIRDASPTYGNAQIALAAIWERALSDVEVAVLSQDMLALIRLRED